MKHCPNPDCPGLEKFRIVSEYKDQTISCADCGGALAYGPAPDPTVLVDRPNPQPDAKIVLLDTIDDQDMMILVGQALDVAEIPFMVKGEIISDLFAVGQVYRINAAIDPVEVHVLETDLDEARAVVAEFLDPVEPADFIGPDTEKGPGEDRDPYSSYEPESIPLLRAIWRAVRPLFLP